MKMKNSIRRKAVFAVILAMMVNMTAFPVFAKPLEDEDIVFGKEAVSEETALSEETAVPGEETVSGETAESENGISEDQVMPEEESVSEDITEPAGGASYGEYVTKKNDTDGQLAAKQVSFNGYKWYIIKDESTGLSSGSVTLFVVDPIGVSKFDDQVNQYNNSAVKKYLNDLTKMGGSFYGVADAIKNTDLPDVSVTGAKLYLLNQDETDSLSTNAKKCGPAPGTSTVDWWLRTNSSSGKASCIQGYSGDLPPEGCDVNTPLGVRPALQLDLSAVKFVSEKRLFVARIGYDVTFRVVNGAWDDGTKADKKVEISGYEDEDLLLRLSSDQIPAVGNKPADGYMKGSWDVVPVTDRRLSENKTYTYTYAKDPNPTPKPETKKGMWVKGINKNGYSYTGSQIKPKISVYFNGNLLTENTDYTAKYLKNKNVGEAQIEITGKGNYKDKTIVSFNIIETDLSKAKADPKTVTATYSKGKRHDNVRPELFLNGTKLTFGKNDVTYTYLNSKGEESRCIEEGKYTIRITAKDSVKGFKGHVDVTMNVVNKPVMKDAKVRIAPKNVKFTGEPVSPVFTVTLSGQTLTEGRDYTLKYSDDHTYPGIHEVVISSNVTDIIGKKTVSFKITGKCDLSDTKKVKTTVDSSGCTYMTGGAKPKITVKYNSTTLKEGRDFKVSYAGNDKAGNTATYTVKGKGAYKGSCTGTFTVQKCDISKDLVITAADRAESKTADDYKKTAITFADSSLKKQKLKEGTDYTADFTSFAAPPAAGTEVKVTIKGAGYNYSGTKKVTYRIKSKDKDISKANVKVNGGKPYDYTGKKISPSKNDIVLKIGKTTVSDDGYEITGYYNNVKKGTATLTLKGKGSYYGDKKVSYKIGAVKLPDIWGGIMKIFQNL